MTDYEEITKNEIVALIDEADESIAALREAGPREMIPEHDFYRAVMFGECESCGNRFVDGDGCAVCKPAKEFLDKYRKIYPWKSDQNKVKEK